MGRRTAFTLALLLGVAGSAWADGPNHVRILWDVERGISCALVRALSDTRPFDLPATLECGAESPVASRLKDCIDRWCRAPFDVVRKGDYVTVYAYRYNAASYKALAPVVTTLKPEEPIAITIFDGLLRAAGFRTSPQWTTFSEQVLKRREADGGSHCVGLSDIQACLNEIEKALAEVQNTVNEWEGMRERAREVNAQRVALPGRLRDPATPRGRYFDIAGLEQLACDFSVTGGKNPLGGGCTAESGWVQRVGRALGHASALIRAFDSAYRTTGVTSAHITHRNRFKRAFDGHVEYLTASQSGIRSEMAAGVAQFADDLTAIKGYWSALDPERARTFAVELPRQGPAGRLNTLVFALPLRFVGDPEGAPAQLTRTYSLKVAPDYPWVLPSAGVVWIPGAFEFKKLAIEQVPTGTGSLARRLQKIDTDEFRDATALLGTGFRLGKTQGYFTVGTTADRKIFRSVLLGGSWFLPKWRSVFTVGRVAAKGSLDEDLDEVIGLYSADGLVPDSLNLAQVFPKEQWKWATVVAWTLTPF